MAYYNRQNFCEEDKMSYSSEQSYGRNNGGFMRPHHNNNRMQVTECDSYTATGYGAQSGYGAQGGYGAQCGYGAPVPAYNNSGACYERTEEMCMSNSEFSGGRRHHKANPFGHRRRRVMRFSETRGSYSSSESDSD